MQTKIQMSMSPASILAKLDELKKWQSKQQERLAIPPETPHQSEERTCGKPQKQPYLRRGAGLGRFRMSPGEQFKPFNSVDSKKPHEKTPLQRAVWEKPSPLNNTDRDLEVFEKLEQRVMNDSFCSTNSSIVQLLSTSTPKLHKKIQDDYEDLLVKAVKFQQCLNADETPTGSLTSLVVDSYDDKTKWTDCNSTVSSECVDKCDVGTMTQEDCTQEQLDVLQHEIMELRKDNAKRGKIKEQLDDNVKKFEKYKKDRCKELEDERAQLEDDRKKLAKEKMIFERYVKDLHNKPTRKEREEISTLKTEVATLKESLKAKETRHGTTQARLRNQIKSLEKEVADLKTEIEEINKRHAKTVVQQKLNAKTINTRMINEINRNLSKLTRKVESDEEVTTDIPVSDRTERLLSDGTKQLTYSNGNTKHVSADGNTIIFTYFNGDIKETNLLEGTIRYHYFDTKINHITQADGTEIIRFPDGQIEHRLKNGVSEIEYPNGSRRVIRADGTERVVYPDGTIVEVNRDEKVITLANGQKEIHTPDYKRREYPDGTVKIMYPDGSLETRYANGYVRLKDKHGNLLPV